MAVGVAPVIEMLIGSGALYEAVSVKLKMVQDVALMAKLHGSDLTKEATQLEILTVRALCSLRCAYGYFCVHCCCLLVSQCA